MSVVSFITTSWEHLRLYFKQLNLPTKLQAPLFTHQGIFYGVCRISSFMQEFLTTYVYYVLLSIIISGLVWWEGGHQISLLKVLAIYFIAVVCLAFLLFRAFLCRIMAEWMDVIETSHNLTLVWLISSPVMLKKNWSNFCNVIFVQVQASMKKLDTYD